LTIRRKKEYQLVYHEICVFYCLYFIDAISLDDRIKQIVEIIEHAYMLLQPFKMKVVRNRNLHSDGRDGLPHVASWSRKFDESYKYS